MITLSLVLGILSLVLAGKVTMSAVAAQKTAETSDDFYRYSQVFAEIFKEIKDKYVDEVDSRQLFEGAIRGMFFELDPHSQYMGPDAYSQLEKDTEGEFSGIGIHITLRNAILTVMSPIPGSPAAQMGVQAWDRIIKIDGKSTEGITLLEAVKKLTGPPGTQVTITVYREGVNQPLDFTITRENIKIDSVYHKFLDKDKIGYVRLAKFSENTSDDLRKALVEMKNQEVQGFILDLRFNTGGLLKQAIEVSEMFLEKDKLIVSTKGRIASQNREYYSRKKPILQVPMIILVNATSASASEIVAGAMKDHGIATIIAPKGEKTFGKGSVQTIEELTSSLDLDENGNPKSNAIRLTTAKYYTPSGKSIHEIGIAPDIEVALPTGNELALARHGLLGDPRNDKPLADDHAATDSLSLSEELTSPTLQANDQKSGEKSDVFFEMRPGTDDKEKKEQEERFIDVQLQEAIRYLRAFFIMSQKRAA
ncbi:MAG: S41 family peptidase [bacterium]